MSYSASSSHGGTLTKRHLSVNDTAGVLVKGTPGKVHGWHISNVDDAVAYVKLYDKATAPTVGSDTPKITLLVPAGGAITLTPGENGPQFSTGIGLGITTGVADNDTTAPAANEVIVNLFYV